MRTTQDDDALDQNTTALPQFLPKIRNATFGLLVRRPEMDFDPTKLTFLLFFSLPFLLVCAMATVQGFVWSHFKPNLETLNSES